MGMPIVIYRSTLSISNHVPKRRVLAWNCPFLWYLCVNFASIFSHSFLTLSHFRHFPKMTVDSKRFPSESDFNQMEMTVLSVTIQSGTVLVPIRFYHVSFGLLYITLYSHYFDMYLWHRYITEFIGHNLWNDNYFIVEHVDSHTNFLWDSPITSELIVFFLLLDRPF